MYRAIDMRLRPPYKSFATTAFYTNLEANKRTKSAYESKAAYSHSMEDMLAEMDECGIEIGVAVARESNWGAPAYNKDLLGLLEEYGDCFVGFPHLQYGREDADPLKIIDDYIINGPCIGAYMEPGFRYEAVQLNVDDERLFPIYEKLEQNNIPLIIQYGGGKATLEYYGAVNIFNLCHAFPKLKICLTHGGWPQVLDMIQQTFCNDNLYLSPDFYFRGYPGSQEYVAAANGILSDKILYGSAFPLATLQETMAQYLESGVKMEVLPKILRENALHFLGLDETENK